VVVVVVVLAAVEVVDAVLVLVSVYDEVLATVDVVVLVLWATRWWSLCKLLSPYSCWWMSKLMMLLLCLLWCLTRSR
jgi:hypothetical protein